MNQSSSILPKTKSNARRLQSILTLITTLFLTPNADEGLAGLHTRFDFDADVTDQLLVVFAHIQI